jgi:hypothetical protein
MAEKVIRTLRVPRYCAMDGQAQNDKEDCVAPGVSSILFGSVDERQFVGP